MNFDRLAPHYGWLEAVCGGGLLQRARTAWLDELRGCRRILSAGEGHGRFAAACAVRFPAAELTCLEPSGAMLARARRRPGAAAPSVRWQQVRVAQWEPDGKFDAIVTCFFLDCFPPDQLAQVVARLAAGATADARWLVTDFALPPPGPARWRAWVVHVLMYGFFRLVCGLPARRLTPPDNLLQAHGFRLEGRTESNWGLLRADVWRRG